MAPKKKPKYKGPQRGGGSPNKILVVFLVFFILCTILMGLLVYKGFSAADEAEKATKTAKAKAASMQNQNDFYAFVMREARQSVGAPFFPDKNDIDEKNFWAQKRDLYLNGQGFSNEKLNGVIKKWVEQNNTNLGYNAKTQSFATTYVQQIADLKKKLATAQANAGQLVKEKEKLQNEYNDLFTKYEEWRKGVVKKLDKDNKQVIAAVSKQSEEMKKLVERNQELKNLMDAQRLDYEGKLLQKRKIISELQEIMENTTGKVAKSGQQGPNRAEGGAAPHALFLDISQGKPFWEQPRGKINKVIPAEKKVYINLGSKDGVKTQLTFNIFDAGRDGRAFGSLKGTIEVQDVIGPHSSLAKVTSLFTPDGKEMPLADTRKGTIENWAQNPIREGDLLYNTFWKTHVVLAGKFNLSDNPTFSVSQDLRNLQQFIHLLERQGIVVDGYLDPTDGKMKGGFRADSQFLILGAQFRTDKELINPDAKMAAPDELNKRMAEFADTAYKQGMFIVSAQNFATMVGYVPPRSGGSSAIGHFQAGQPFAGQPFEVPGAGLKKRKGY